MRIFKDFSDLVGNTPLVEIENYSKKENATARILVKLEYFNPAGSVKDRAALYMINDAEEKGLLNKNSVIIEPTSGNTGIGLAAVAARKGYRVVLTMPESMSVERRSLLSAYGAEIILTPANEGMAGAVKKAEELKKELPDSIIAGQFYNPANVEAHFKTTGPEIWNDTDGEVDIFVAGVGTGGTVSGTGEFLKSQNPKIKVYAVEPTDSPLLSKGESGSHKIQGIGANFIPKNYKEDVVDGVLTVSADEAYYAARTLARTEGFLVGISSGAALFAATKLAKLEENKGKTIVVLLPDTGDRYLSTELFKA